MTAPVSAAPLAGKTALVTGAAQGLGAAYAQALYAAGAKVTLADVRVEAGKALAADLGPRAQFVALDVREEDDWAAAIAVTVAAYDTIDVLVNNAGIANAAPIEHFTREKWDAVLGVNLTGVFLGCRAVTPTMKAQRSGSIINISSVEGMRGSPGLHGYTAAKYGVRGLSASLAVELGPYGIRVNSVHPGYITTRMSERIDPERLDIPLRRPGKPEDVAGTIVFLASDASAFTSGAEFVVDGGMIAGIPHR